MRVPVALLAATVLFAACLEPERDSDGDGYADALESEAGTDPHNAASRPGADVHAMQAMDWAPTWGGLDAPIRPGAPIGWCTYNFLFVAPENGTYYIGTAAHCTDEIGQRVPLAGFQEEIGTVVYDSDNATDGGDNADFSLIQLDPGRNLEAHPAMMNLAGPRGHTTAADVEVGDVIEHHGYGMVLGELEQTRDRQGVFSGWSGGPGHDYCSESPIWWGDSGSPVLHQETQKAFGIVSRAGWIDCVPTAQLMGATLEYIFEELAEHGWSGVELAIVA